MYDGPCMQLIFIFCNYITLADLINFSTGTTKNLQMTETIKVHYTGFKLYMHSCVACATQLDPPIVRNVVILK